MMWLWLLQQRRIVWETEQTSEGIIDILEYQHSLVPHMNGRPVQLFAVGDQKTFERSLAGQSDRSDSPTPSTRFEGLLPAIADFHAYGNFYEVLFSFTTAIPD